MSSIAPSRFFGARAGVGESAAPLAGFFGRGIAASIQFEYNSTSPWLIKINNNYGLMIFRPVGVDGVMTGPLIRTTLPE